MKYKISYSSPSFFDEHARIEEVGPRCQTSPPIQPVFLPSPEVSSGMTATEDVPVAVLALLSIIAISGATSNILVCLVITCTKKMRNATTLFILNLAVSDILYSSISIPLKLVSIANKHYWTLGNLGCKVVMFGPLFCITSSIYTMVAISHERRVDVMNGLHKKITLRQAKIAIVMIWILAVVSSAPQIYEYSTYKKVVLNSGSSQESESHSDEIPNSTAADGVESANLADLFAGGDEEADGRPRIVGGGSSEEIILPENFTDFHHVIACGSHGIAHSFEETYSICIFIIGYIVPLFIILINYLLLGRFILKHSQSISAHGAGSAVSKRKVKIVKMLITVVIVFAVCWAPFFALFVREEVLGLDDSVEFASALHTLKLTLSTLSTLSNPIIYMVFNGQFRQDFKWLCICNQCINSKVGVVQTSSAERKSVNREAPVCVPAEVVEL